MPRRSYRFYLRRQSARARRTRDKVQEYLECRCAAIIQSILRGRLGRRKARTCAYLSYIRKAHPISLTKALSRGGEVKVFWYKSKEQVRLLFSNYLLLTERTGFTPPRYIVEANIHEIVRPLSDTSQVSEGKNSYRHSELKPENTSSSPQFNQDGAALLCES